MKDFVPAEDSVRRFLASADLEHTRTVFLHVDRPEELDVRKLHSEWLAAAMLDGVKPIDLATFRELILQRLRDDAGERFLQPTVEAAL